MFDHLMESRRRRERRLPATVVSVVAHTALITCAVALSLRADPSPAIAPPVERELRWQLPTTRNTLTEQRGRAAGRPTSEPAPEPAPLVVVDLVPTSIPPIDPGAVVDVGALVAADSRRSDVGSDSAATGAGALDPGGVFVAGQVEEVASLRPGNPPPRYPAILRAAGVEGRVEVRFVVDTTGRAEVGTIELLASTHDGFAEAVRETVPRLRFVPATTGGRRVRMMVVMPFVFEIERR